MHGFDEWYGNLYHLNAEEEPEELDYPGQVNPKLRTAEQSAKFTEMFAPRGMLHTWATDVDDPTDQPTTSIVNHAGCLFRNGPRIRHRSQT